MSWKCHVLQMWLPCVTNIDTRGGCIEGVTLSMCYRFPISSYLAPLHPGSPPPVLVVHMALHPRVSLFSINRCHPINWITSLISTQEPKYKVLYVAVQWRCNCVWCCVNEIDLTFWYHHVVMLYALKDGCDCLTLCWLHFNFGVFWPSSQI